MKKSVYLGNSSIDDMIDAFDPLFFLHLIGCTQVERSWLASVHNHVIMPHESPWMSNEEIWFASFDQNDF